MATNNNSHGSNSVRTKMPVSERAKQFMPFAALRGFEEAITAKEREFFRESRAELSPEAQSEISAALSSLRPDDNISLSFFDGFAYISGSFRVVSLTQPSEFTPGTLTVSPNAPCPLQVPCTPITIDFADIKTIEII